MTLRIWWMFICGAGFMMGLVMGSEGETFGWVQAILLLGLAFKKAGELEGSRNAR